MRRRKFLFWVSLGVFELGELLRASSFDRVAAALIDAGAPSAEPKPADDDDIIESEEPDEGEPGRPDENRRARDGRPPSQWLRSLNAEELRVWLPKIDPPEAGVSGMTFWTHLTRDHSFDAENIKGLTLDEQAKLHAAAHDGY